MEKASRIAMAWRSSIRLRLQLNYCQRHHARFTPANAELNLILITEHELSETDWHVCCRAGPERSCQINTEPEQTNRSSAPSPYAPEVPCRAAGTDAGPQEGHCRHC